MAITLPAMNGLLARLKRRLTTRRLRSLDVNVRHAELSALFSADDEAARPSARLLDLALAAAAAARSVSMADVCARMPTGPFYPEVWPGEHYKLLAGLIAVMRPRTVVEIGTFTGMSALAIKNALPPGSRLVTFDLVAWNQFPDTCLRPDDFADGRLTQILADVADPAAMRQHADVFRDAQLIFADGPKDGRFEQVLLDRLDELQLSQNPLVVFDDIRVWNMLKIWRGIRRPKLDVTSLGHWSGTGFVDWTAAS